MPKKKQPMILEDKLFRCILKMKNMTYKDFFELYQKKSVEQNTDEQPGCTYSGFIGWLTVYGIKFKRIPSFLDLLGYRLIAVPKDASIMICTTEGDTGQAVGTLPWVDDTQTGIQVVTVESGSQKISTEFLENQYRFSLRRRSKSSDKKEVS
ncbi:hypothetical protein [Angelakisella massiliensis]|uniref:hypothetical protein n=1 Tax=Angelakisella massiliensis TaxID=1871018 RepID=UPI001113657C|nr:hypothetical protein [Angelakisella massiliensis]